MNHEKEYKSEPFFESRRSDASFHEVKSIPLLIKIQEECDEDSFWNDLDNFFAILYNVKEVSINLFDEHPSFLDKN